MRPPAHHHRWPIFGRAVTIGAVLVLTACGSSDSGSTTSTTPSGSAAPAVAVDAAARAKLPPSVVSAGTLTNAINVPNPPLEYHDTATTKLTGLDVELTEALAAKLGLTPKYSEVNFEQLLTSLTTGRADIVLSGLSDTVERQKSADWIDYFESGDRFYTTADNASKFPDYASLCGQAIAVAAGTSFVTDVPALSATECAGKEPMKVIDIAAQGTAGLEILIKTGRAAAGVTGAETFGYLTQTAAGKWAAVGDIFAKSPYGIAVKAGNDGLRDAVAAALQSLLDDGTYGKILAKWGQQSSAVTSVKINLK